jgi:hypothetical protein
MTDNLASAYGHMLSARLLVEIELQADPTSYELADTRSLLDDACSQIRGALALRQDTRYDHLGGAA